MKNNRVGIGIDVGGTLTKIVAVSASGRRLCDFEAPTLPEEGPRRFVDRISSSISALKLRIEAYHSLGVGLAGDVDSLRGALRFAPNLKGFAGFSFKSAFQKKLKVPVVVDNDANMAAWGAYVVELKRKPTNMACLTLGTGIGGGLVIGGKLYQGGTGSAAESGHMCVEPDGELCHCGMRGCLEAYAGSYGITRTARKLLEARSGRRSLLHKICPDLDFLEPVMIEAAAKKGDAVARAVWNVTGYYLGIGIANIVYLLNPDVVIMVGGVSRAGSFILNPVMDVLKKRPFRTPFNYAGVRIARAQHLGGVGCALAGLEAGKR